MKGYSLDKLNKKALEKAEGFEEILEKDSEIIEKAKKVLDEKGDVFVIKKKKVIKAIYLFDQIENEEKKKIIRFNYELKLEELTPEIIEHYENAIVEEIKENISLGDIYKLDWEGKSAEKSYVKIGNKLLPLGVVLFVVFSVLSIVLKEVALFSCGLVLALCCGVASTGEIMEFTFGKKNKKEKNDDEK